jgi:inorganic pyrophosphatase
MQINKISAGALAPAIVNVIIEIPALSQPVKYEIDKESGAIFVDRFLATPMFYPCHYGFVPQTLAGDGDPIDVLVWCPYVLSPGVVIPSRIIGVLEMDDDGGEDVKLLAVPAHQVSPLFNHIEDIDDLPKELLAQIKHFFEHYKDLEPTKWVKVREFKNKQSALDLLTQALKAY